MKLKKYFTSIMVLMLLITSFNTNVFAKTSVKISSIKNLSAKVYQGRAYSLPKTVTATMSNKTKKTYAIKWSKKPSTAKVGTYKYYGTVAGYSKKVTLTLSVIPKPITITSIANLSAKVNQYSTYSLPKTVTATMSNKTKKTYAITWSQKPSTTKAGTFKYYGTVAGYSKKVTLTLTVNPDSEPLTITSIS